MSKYVVNPNLLKENLLMKDILIFNKMITPIIIQILFWISLVGCLIIGAMMINSGLSSRYGGSMDVLVGVMLLIIGPIVSRVYCEILIVVFTINKSINDIKTELMKDRQRTEN